MTEQFANFAQSNLSSQISASQATITVASPSTFPLLGTFRIVIQSFDATTNAPVSGAEIMIVNSVAGNVFSVTRGAEGTQAIAAASGAKVTHIVTAGVMQLLSQGGGGGGNVTGPASSTDNAIARFDGTTGQVIQNSLVTVDDSGVIGSNGANLSGNLNLATTTSSRALVTDASKNVVSSATTATEIGYVNGVTSAIQTQLDGKQNTVSLTTAGTAGAATFNSSTGALNIPNYAGTVTSVSVVSANGLAGTVATSTTTPAITLSTSVTGIVKGNGTTLSAAVAGDFPTLNQNTTGNADTATLAAASSSETITNDTTTNATMYPVWVTANSGNLPAKVSSTSLSFNPFTGTLSATNFNGAYTGTASFSDAAFQLFDDVDNTKTGKFQLAGLTTGVNAVYTLPNGAALTLATISNLTQTFLGSTTFSGAAVTVGSSTAASTYGLGNGATLAATTKTINIGTSGVSTSVTNVNIGSVVAGALGALTINSPTVTLKALSASGQITSTLATGTAPLVIASTTLVPNLYVARAALADTTTTNANLTGAVTSVGNATLLGSFTSSDLAAALTDETGSGAAVFATNPSITLTSATGLPLATGVTGTLPVANGGTGQTTYTNGQLLIGNTTGNTLTKATLTAGSGVTVTNSTGSITIASSATSLINSLAADVALNNTANYFDGPSVAQGVTGTFLVTGTVTCRDSAGSTGYNARIFDGTTTFASTSASAPSANLNVTMSLSAIVTNPAGNLRIQVRDGSSTSGLILFNTTGLSKDSTISVVRIA